MRLKQCAVYNGGLLIAVWIVGALYLTFVYEAKDGGKVKNDDGTDSVLEKLEVRVSRLSVQLIQQQEENKRLRHEVVELAKTTTSAVPNHEQIAVLVMACNRPEAVTNHLGQLLKLRPSAEQFPIIVSQDCVHEATSKAVEDFGDQVTLVHQPDQRDIQVPPGTKRDWKVYYKISRHYKWALNKTFFNMGFKAVIITEDDLDISVDFFEYFAATSKLLQRDDSLMCVSAWNDNGKKDLIENDHELLWRTDFFPGLGWMLTSDAWDELNQVWPNAFWDDWLRTPQVRKGRSCIRPEISRTSMSNFGKNGSSKKQFFDKHIKKIASNDGFVAFTEMNLDYLIKEEYDEMFETALHLSPEITIEELTTGTFSNSTSLPHSVRLTYSDPKSFKVVAKRFELMDDFRAGVPRTAYRGVVPFMYKNIRVYFAPTFKFTEYDPNWH